MAWSTPLAHASAVPAAARPYQGRRAGIASRIAANAVDLIVVVLILALIYALIAGGSFVVNPSSFHWPDGLGWSIPVIGFVIVVPYLALCWTATGRTYGAVLLGLRIVNFRGNRVHLFVAVLRALACVLFPIGLFWTVVNPSNRSLQDVVLRTSVIYDWAPRALPPDDGPG